MSNAVRLEIVKLILGARWACLATLDERGPLASMVAYAAEPGLSGLLMFLSGLSAHTRNLLAVPRASLAIGEPDAGAVDPQTLARVSLRGSALVLPRDGSDFSRAWQQYVERFPAAAPRLGLADFVLFRFVADEARYVGGFARTARLSGDGLREAAAALDG